jgi:5-methyltetrahydrofolate--homocysteine methyltransferase
MIIIGEKINGSIPSMAKAIAERNAEHIANLAKKQADAGAAFIDVCASVDPAVELETLHWMIDVVQGATDTPIAIDSPNSKTCADAIPFTKRVGLINSVSMEGDKIEQVFPVIANTKWEVVALLNDDTGITRDVDKRLSIFEATMKKAKAYGIAPNRLHRDPLVQMLCTSENGIENDVAVIKEIKAQYPDIHITGGASNISFNLPARKFVNQGFMILAMNAGMDSAITDPLNRDMMGLIYATEALLNQDEMCMEFISAYREGIFGDPPKAK